MKTKDISIDGYGDAWPANYVNSSVTELNNSGAALSPTAGYTSAGVGAPFGLAVNPH